MDMQQILVREDEFGVSDYSDDESIDESIKASMERIRQEASRMDLYIALDRIDSLQQENVAVKSTLRAREAELEVLEEKVSSLIMERDMLKVDTDNLKEDMTTLVDKMFEISCVAGTSSLADSTHSIEHHKDNLSRVDETGTLPPDVMIFNEPCTAFESDPSENDDKLLTLRSEDVGDMMQLTMEAESNSSGIEPTCSISSTTTENRQSAVIGSVSECQHNKRLCFIPSPHMKKSNEVRPVYTLRPVESKRTIFRRFIRWLASCSRSKQVAALQDQLDQLQSMVHLSIANTEQLQLQIVNANQKSPDDDSP